MTAVAGTNNVLNTSGTNSIVITAPEGKYTAAKVTVKQAGVDDQTPAAVTTKTTANGVDTFTVSGITAASTGLVTVTVEMTAGTKTITPVVTNTIASSPAVEKTGTTGADYYVDSVKALDAGVYAFPTGIVQTQLANGNPLYRGGTDVADEDCLIFVFEKSGLVETYTFTIDNVSTYVESMTGAAGNVTNSFFHVQVNDNKSGDFSNSGNGSMQTMALAAGPHDYSIVGSKSGTVASGTFTIKKDGDEFTNPNLAAAPIGNKTDSNTYDQLIKEIGRAHV